nr:uncharacterized protein LOC109152764 [Ipomoea batatas]
MVIPTLGVPLSAPSLGHDISLPATQNSAAESGLLDETQNESHNIQPRRSTRQRYIPVRLQDYYCDSVIHGMSSPPSLRPPSIYRCISSNSDLNLRHIMRQSNSSVGNIYAIFLQVTLDKPATHKNLETVAPAFPTALNVHSPCISEGTNCLLGLQV